jgi:glycine dehydrogenase
MGDDRGASRGLWNGELSEPSERFSRRHFGPSDADVAAMLDVVGFSSLDALTEAAIPRSIAFRGELALPAAATEMEALDELRAIAAKNLPFRSFIGQGYADCVVPPVIQRNVLENPGWYTQYTPYQAEIAQGRLEALLNFQTMVVDLTGLPLANASLLDEATAAAEALSLFYQARAGAKRDARTVLVAQDLHPQSLALLATRSEPLGIRCVVVHRDQMRFDADVFAAVVQWPTTDGVLFDLPKLLESAKAAGVPVAVGADLLSLCLLEPPGAFGAEIVFGSAQRFGVPMGYGGPHAAFFATRAEHQRRLPGRLVGVSRDRNGRPAYRLTLQTREQHIRRDKATSNICTAQVLLAVMAGAYAVYHGPEGLRDIALRVHSRAVRLAERLRRLGYDVGDEPFFDTLVVRGGPRPAAEIHRAAAARQWNFRACRDGAVALTLDERTSAEDVEGIIECFGGAAEASKPAAIASPIPERWRRRTPFLTHPVFHRYRSETEMQRYLRTLESRDLSLTHSMIPLGSCTMKLNAAAEMFPMTWREFASPHPFAPPEQNAGYRRLFEDLERWLAEITGFAAVSLQPNSGAQGEYAGLLVIRAYHRSRGEAHRDVCLIPTSAHGTNPASAAMAGMRVVTVKCDASGNVDLSDLEARVNEHRDKLAALMVTYPSTHGVFETTIEPACRLVHQAGGQVYLDGANLNAQVGLCRPGDYGADVCHLNLHKTFCIPHGGGGPGMGPIGVARHLVPFLPTHPVVPTNEDARAIGPVSAAPWGSASILSIPWMYIRMMGPDGLKRASQLAILNANYVAKRLEKTYPILYRAANGLVAHECILDLRELKRRADVEVEDVAKRLMDYGFHAPTVSWPVAGTMMVEPTESESKAELDRFCDAMLAIAAEVDQVATGAWDRKANPLKNAPHVAKDLEGPWPFPYSVQTAMFPSRQARKFWPEVARVDGVYGDRNLFCTCPPTEEAALSGGDGLDGVLRRDSGKRDASHQ